MIDANVDEKKSILIFITKLQNLYAKLDKRDKDLFMCDMETIDWATFLYGSMLGVRKHLMKEDSKNIPAARKRMNR